ncbi:unnamed protein product, partial [marine sediment metagenome]
GINIEIIIREYINGVGGVQQNFTCLLNTIYYLRIKRDEGVGANGTLYCDIYISDADRTNVENAVANMSIALTAKIDFRYIYAVQSRDLSDVDAITFWTEKLNLQEGWTGKINGVTNPAKINGVAVADIAKVNGVISS